MIVQPYISTVEEEGEELVPVFLDTLTRAVQYLRDALRGKDESYEEVSLINAFRSTATAQLATLCVTHEEDDVVGASEDCYKQVYHYARTTDEEPGGNGSLRCLLTKAIRGPPFL